MLRIKDGFKHYKGRVVLEDINLEFHEGVIYGLVGINGSGKTLILKALAGYLKLDKGAVYQGQTRIRSKHNYIHDAGILIENPEFISHMTLLENLQLIKGLCRHKQTIDLQEWLDLYQLEPFKDTLYKNLSLGTKKKMALIQAFMDQPSILILDEPMNALDAKSVERTKRLLVERKENSLIILTSHVSSDMDELCDVVCQVEEGRVIADHQSSAVH